MAFTTGFLKYTVRLRCGGPRYGRTGMAAPLECILGDWRCFIEYVHTHLCANGLDPLAAGHELDHVCYRVASVDEYLAVRSALVPAHGVCLVESMIAGRPISIVRLHDPLCHAGYAVPCVELPCPKPGRPYDRGLEHVEFAISRKRTPVARADDVRGCAALEQFVAERRADTAWTLEFDTRGMSKVRGLMA